MKKKTLTEALVLEDFQKAVVFLTLLKIKKNFNNASEYANSKHNDKAKYLHIDSKILKRFSKFDNKRLFNKFLQKSDNLFDFHKHVALKYASGKKFKINSWFELKFSIDELDEYLKNDYYMSLKSELYSKRVHKILDNLFNSKKKEESNTTKAEEKKEDNMTKAEEKAIYDKAANGQLGCSPEYVIKQIKKKERSQKRRQETVAKNAIKASFKEFANLEVENKQLKAEIAKLKQLKDLNSDIPSESIDNSELEKLKADAAMWRKIDSDPFACEQHYNEVLSRMQPAEDDDEEDIVVDQAMQAQFDQISELEGIAPKQQLHPDNDIPDVPPEPAHVKPPVDDIPDKEPTYPSKVLYRLAEFVKKCYINPNAASRLAAMYGENQTFKSPKVQCDLVAALQSNVEQRLFILKDAHKELRGKLNKKDLDWLVSNINKTEKELKTIN